MCIFLFLTALHNILSAIPILKSFLKFQYHYDGYIGSYWLVSKPKTGKSRFLVSFLEQGATLAPGATLYKAWYYIYYNSSFRESLPLLGFSLPYTEEAYNPLRPVNCKLTFRHVNTAHRNMVQTSPSSTLRVGTSALPCRRSLPDAVVSTSLPISPAQPPSRNSPQLPRELSPLVDLLSS